jgi:outer membrane protein assembly factor BamA
MINRSLHKTLFSGLSALILLLVAACSNTRFLADDQLLYTGRNKISVTVKEGDENPKAAMMLAKSITYVKPNNALSASGRAFLPLGLWTYNYRKPKAGKSPKWLYRNLAKPPVLITDVNPELRSRKLESDLFNIGYFNSHVWASIDTSPKNPKKAKITYRVEVYPRFRLRNVVTPLPHDRIDTLIIAHISELKTQQGSAFNLPALQGALRNITNEVREQGYFYFQPEYLTLVADTTAGNRLLDLQVAKKDDVPVIEAYKTYQVGGIRLSLSDGISDRPEPSGTPEAFLDELTLDGLNNYVKPKVLSDAINFVPGKPYSYTQHQNTLRNLNNLGIFKYVDIEFTPVADSMSNKLDVGIGLTTMKNVRFEAEANVVTKSTGFSGPAVEASLIHGNMFQGANKLQLKLDAGYEWQWGSESETQLGFHSYNIGFSSSFTMPRLVLPRNWIHASRNRTKNTVIDAGFDFMNKVKYYRMYSVNARLDYNWRRSGKVSHSFSPVYLNSVKLLETTPDFDEIINSNPSIKKSFEEQFIAGMRYNAQIDLVSAKKMNQLSIFTGVATSGNLIAVSQKLVSGETEGPDKFLGNIYSQFIRFTEEVRYNRKVFDHSFVFRIYAGIGIPYGNSSVLPYVEQFYSGGANSIRAFTARSLGPGSYKVADTTEFIDQTGDIRLEGNMEFRFSLTSKLKGALFLDAGNVWLLNDDPGRPGAAFKFSDFTGQLAVGTGFGLRYDLGFIVMRGDFGFPLRYPYPDNDSNWIQSIHNMFSNTLFHFAIGYPF